MDLRCLWAHLISTHSISPLPLSPSQRSSFSPHSGRQLLSASTSPSLSHTQTHTGILSDGSEWSLDTTFHVHDDVEICPETNVATRLVNTRDNGGRRTEVTHQRAIKKGSMTLNVSPPKDTFEPRKLATNFCDETCAPYKDILALEGDVIITWNGTEYTVGEYELCLECLEYKYEFKHIRNWTVFNYDLEKDEVMIPEFTIDIPTLEATSGGEKRCEERKRRAARRAANTTITVVIRLRQ